MSANTSTETATGGSAVITGAALVLHVARRASFGPTPELLAEIEALGVDAWVEQQLHPAAIDDHEVDAALAPLSDLRRTPAELQLMQRRGNDAIADLRVAALVRAARSNRHLQEVMVDLWHDQLTASALKSPVEWHLPMYDRTVIRPLALGRYVDLLKAATRSGAMLEYLDTVASSAPKVNENHGRELLELHTVGAGAYSQSDVVGAARVLSGWTVDPLSLEVVHDPERHDARPAAVLGWTTPGRAGAAGAGDLDLMLEHLALLPATARRIASVLIRRFVSDEPPAALVESTAATYLQTGSDLAATLHHVLTSDDFRTGGTPLVRRPFDLFAALLRATSAAIDVPNLVEQLVVLPQPVAPLAQPVVDTTGLVDPLVDPAVGWALPERRAAWSTRHVLQLAGQPLFAAPNPAGHPLAAERWSTGDGLLRRWSLAADLVHNRVSGIRVDPPSLAIGASTAGEAVDLLAQRCFGTPPGSATRSGALDVVGLTEDEPIGDPSLFGLGLAFLLSAPEMQTR